MSSDFNYEEELEKQSKNCRLPKDVLKKFIDANNTFIMCYQEDLTPNFYQIFAYPSFMNMDKNRKVSTKFMICLLNGFNSNHESSDDMFKGAYFECLYMTDKWGDVQKYIDEEIELFDDDDDEEYEETVSENEIDNAMTRPDEETD